MCAQLPANLELEPLGGNLLDRCREFGLAQRAQRRDEWYDTNQASEGNHLSLTRWNQRLQSSEGKLDILSGL